MLDFATVEESAFPERVQHTIMLVNARACECMRTVYTQCMFLHAGLHSALCTCIS